MTQYINKDALEAEIDKLDNQDFSVIDDLNGRTAYLQAIGDFYKALDNLEVKEVDLEKKITPSLVENMLCYFGVQSIYDMDSENLAEFARHFFELGLKAQK